MGMGWWCSIIIRLLLIVAPLSSVLPKNVAKAKVAFDCTQVINELLLSNSNPASMSLLQTALNQSEFIYYEWVESVEHFFPEVFLGIAEVLESAGWKPGATDDDGTGKPLFLNFRMPKSFPYLERLQLQSIHDAERYDLLLPKFKRIRLHYNGSWSAIKIPLSFWVASDHSCEIFGRNRDYVENVENYVTWVVAIRSLLGIVGPEKSIVDYSQHQLDCLNVDSYFSKFLKVLSIDLLTAYGLPESYGLFSDLMNSAVELNKKFLKSNGIRVDNKRLIRLQLKPLLKDTSSSDQDELIERGYAALLSRFAVRWASETGENIILEATEPIISNMEGSVKELVPTIRDYVIPYSRGDYDCNDGNLISPELASQTSQRFNLLYVDLIGARIVECVRDLHWCAAATESEEERRNCTSSDFQLHGGNNSLMMLVEMAQVSLESLMESEEETDRNLEHALREFKKFKNTTRLPIHSLLFDGLTTRRRFSQLVEASGGVVAATQIGCTVEYHADLGFNIATDNDSVLADKLSQYCNLPQVNLIIFRLDHIVRADWVQMDVFRYISVVQPTLYLVYSAIRKLKNSFPAVSVVLRFPSGRAHSDSLDDEHNNNVFCNTGLEDANKIVEAWVTWSYIHKVPIVIKGLVSTDSHLGWWERLDAPGSGGVYVTRNHPQTMGYLKGEPCLELHRESPKSPIQMFASGMGCTVHVPEEVGPQELEVMLDFALLKFSNVEIIIASNFNEVIIPVLEHTLLTVTTKQVHIFLQVPLENLKLAIMHSRIMFQVSKLIKELQTNKLETKISIQISNLKENHDAPDLEDSTLQTFIQQSIAGGISSLGVVVDNCIRGIFANGYLESKTFFSHVTFLVCATRWDNNIQSEQSRSESYTYFKQMGGALDQLYAIKTVFKRKFPDKEIYFRPEFHTSNEADFLRTVRDVNRHAELYDMKYFVVNAFDYPPSTGRGSFWRRGWWRVEDIANLADPFNYFERESEYLNRTTLRPAKRPKRTQDGTVTAETVFSWWVFVPSAVGAIMVIIALVLFALWKRSESRYLTRIEELEFRNGSITSPDMDGWDASSVANQFLKMKFDKNYEIPKTNLQSDEAAFIGGGSFGVVYKALVKGTLVAVKIPKQGCSPDRFKTTLQEIKIMCYVGCHENVVRFVGAYVKEIGRGILQIATELCVNGPLLGHLLNLSESVMGADLEKNGTISSELVAGFDLERFCMEIAAGMDFLASKRVIHGDLATRNVLLYEYFTCKIADFGLSRKLYEYETCVKDSKELLPWRWMALETLDKREFSIKSDVWSYGVTAWEIYSLGSFPYPNVSWTTDFVTSLSSGLRLQKPKYSTDDLYGKLSECWNIEPEARPTFSELCQYFRTIRAGQYASVLSSIQESTP